ncbi:MAG: hypothetical protein MjAS7_0475 [Metallosphaera javensis (ex Sakai et al. 2022)]|nr:MAG: hypothetical protein MjAS7_0475 [Metallosphaera javensis (ex Sakai et al. 2022)]
MLLHLTVHVLQNVNIIPPFSLRIITSPYLYPVLFSIKAGHFMVAISRV